MPILCDTDFEIDLRCNSKVILSSKVSPYISRDFKFFNYIPLTCNTGESGCGVNLLDTVMVLVFSALSCIPNTHFTTPLLWLNLYLRISNRDPICRRWNHRQQSRIICIPNQIIFQIREEIRRNNKGPETLPEAHQT